MAEKVLNSNFLGVLNFAEILCKKIRLSSMFLALLDVGHFLMAQKNLFINFNH